MQSYAAPPHQGPIPGPPHQGPIPGPPQQGPISGPPQLGSSYGPSHQGPQHGPPWYQGIMNCFRFQVAVTQHGRKALYELYKARYLGGQQDVKTFFISLGHSMGNYKKTFDALTRTALECIPPKPEEYDITILYKLLREVCGFSNSDVDWAGPGPSLMESLIQQVKQERNSIAHAKDIKIFTDPELEFKLDHFKNCIISLVTNPESKIPSQRATDLQNDIESDFKNVMLPVREPLNPTKLSQNDFKQLQKELQLCKSYMREVLKKKSKAELCQYYPQLWSVTIADWLYPNFKISRPSLNYTSLVIREDTLSSSDQPRIVPHQDLLQVRRRDKKKPQVLIIYGEGGIGKTTTLQYLMEMWVNEMNDNPSNIKGLKDIFPFLFYQLRGSNVCSWTEMLKHLLWETYQNCGITLEFLADTFLDMNTLVLLDGFDEACADSKKLVKDLINLRGNLQLVITTRPGSLHDLQGMLRTRKLELSVEIIGVQNHINFIHNTVIQLESDQNRQNHLKLKLDEDLRKQEKSHRECLNVPLILILMVLRRIELHPGNEPTQDLYQDLSEFLIEKAADRLAGKGVYDAKANTNKFFKFLGMTSLRTLRRMEYDLDDLTVEEFEKECSKLNIPYKDILSGFLVSKRGRRGNQILDIWSFPHQSFQQHWASMYLVKKLGAEFNNTVTCSYQSCEIQDNRLIKIYAIGSPEAELSEIVTKESRVLVPIIYNVMRILRYTSPDLIEKISHAIVQALVYRECYISDKKFNFDTLCYCVEESGFHESFVQECEKVLSLHTKIITDLTSRSGLKYLLPRVPLQGMTITTTNEKETISIVPQLPKSLIELDLNCGGEEVLQVLADRLPQLIKLEYLEIMLRKEVRPSEIKALPYQGQWLVLWYNPPRDATLSEVSIMQNDPEVFDRFQRNLDVYSNLNEACNNLIPDHSNAFDIIEKMCNDMLLDTLANQATNVPAITLNYSNIQAAIATKLSQMIPDGNTTQAALVTKISQQLPGVLKAIREDWGNPSGVTAQLSRPFSHNEIKECCEVVRAISGLRGPHLSTTLMVNLCTDTDVSRIVRNFEGKGSKVMRLKNYPNFKYFEITFPGPTGLRQPQSSLAAGGRRTSPQPASRCPDYHPRPEPHQSEEGEEKDAKKDGSMTVPAPVKWAQRTDLVFLTICVGNCKNPTINIESDKIYFKAIGGTEKKTYENTLTLFKDIDTEESRSFVQDRNIELTLVKKEAGPYWSHLLKEKTKQHWLTVDFNRWKDEDDTDDEEG